MIYLESNIVEWNIFSIIRIYYLSTQICKFCSLCLLVILEQIIIFDKISFKKIIFTPNIFGIRSFGVGGQVSHMSGTGLAFVSLMMKFQ